MKLNRFLELIKEHPDQVNLNGAQLMAFDTDTFTFEIMRGGIVYADKESTHLEMNNILSQHFTNKIDISQSGITILKQPDKKVWDMFAANYDTRRRMGFIKAFPKGLIGRIWRRNDLVSFWNTEKAFNKENGQLMMELMRHHKMQPEDCVYEVPFEQKNVDENLPEGEIYLGSKGYWDAKWQLVNFDKFKTLLSNNAGVTKYNTSRAMRDMQAKLHTFTGPFKKQALKMFGVKPKTSGNLSDKMKLRNGD